MLEVYKNDNCHCAGMYTKVAVGDGKESLKGKALRRPRKTDIQGADVTRCNSDNLSTVNITAGL